MSEITSSSLKCVVVTGIVVGVAKGLTGEVPTKQKLFVGQLGCHLSTC